VLFWGNLFGGAARCEWGDLFAKTCVGQGVSLLGNGEVFTKKGRAVYSKGRGVYSKGRGVY
jgi:hypothetical protein